MIVNVTAPSDALRMFIAAFNSEGGFPYEIKIKKTKDMQAKQGLLLSFNYKSRHFLFIL